ncbi:hypothetical protein ACE1TF_05215 [Geomicrobium sp. JSM 1781026]|uniref:hypothetical protein n=1 Tax=Geomicrobium sp. JSM 1781026 TaxID=3344580 RepID=UPI0035C1E959
MTDEDFYEKVVDKEEYKEFSKAKLNVREKTSFKDVNALQKKYHIPSSLEGNGFQPDRQFYLFISVSQDGKSEIDAIDDAENERLITHHNN